MIQIVINGFLEMAYCQKSTTNQIPSDCGWAMMPYPYPEKYSISRQNRTSTHSIVSILKYLALSHMTSRDIYKLKYFIVQFRYYLIYG